MIKPITKRERLLMKKAFEAARKTTIIRSGVEGNVLPLISNIHGNFKDFLFKSKYKVK